MLFPQPEQNERFRARREAARRRRRRRRAALVGISLTATATLAAGARFVIDGEDVHVSTQTAGRAAPAQPPAKAPRNLPDEVRGIHVTMALASLDGKLDEYLKLVDEGLNAIELD